MKQSFIYTIALLRTFNTNRIKIDEDPNNYEDFLIQLNKKAITAILLETKKKKKIVNKIESVAWHCGVENKYNNNRYVLVNCFNLLNMLN